MTDWYHIVSALLLLWVAMIWSGKGGVNILFKATFTAVALWGAVAIAKDLL